MPTVTRADTPHKRSIILYDPADSMGGGVVQGVDVDTSLVSRYPSHIAVWGLDGTTIATVEILVHPDQPIWIEAGTIDGSVAVQGFITFSEPPNFARVRRSSGTANYVAADQRA